MPYRATTPRLAELFSAISGAFGHTVALHDPDTFPEQLSDPHPKLTPTCHVIGFLPQALNPADPLSDPEYLTPHLSDYLETVAPYYGLTVTGSYIAAVILEPI